MELTQLAAALPTDAMPGETDPATYALPQQPMHRCCRLGNLPSASTAAEQRRLGLALCWEALHSGPSDAISVCSLQARGHALARLKPDHVALSRQGMCW